MVCKKRRYYQRNDFNSNDISISGGNLLDFSGSGKEYKAIFVADDFGEFTTTDNNGDDDWGEFDENTDATGEEEGEQFQSASFDNQQKEILKDAGLQKSILDLNSKKLKEFSYQVFSTCFDHIANTSSASNEEEDGSDEDGSNGKKARAAPKSVPLRLGPVWATVKVVGLREPLG